MGTLGYVLMLVIMTYSGPLVISAIIGLTIGHLITNWTVKSIEEVELGGSTPCCKYEGDKFDDNNNGEEKAPTSYDATAKDANELIVGLAFRHLMTNWTVKSIEDSELGGLTSCCQYEGDTFYDNSTSEEKAPTSYGTIDLMVGDCCNGRIRVVR